MSDSPESRAGGLMMIGFEGTECDRELRELLEEIQPFGVIFFARNITSRAQLLELTSAIAEARPGTVLAIDHEGGRVDRMPEGFTRLPPALAMARAGDPGLLRDIGRLHAHELRAAGFHIDFAPVLDVHTRADNPVIGDRAFGTTPEEVIHNALPYLQGLTEGGLVGCGKHFPGHGDTDCDSHLELPRLRAADHGIDRLRSLELRPFARAIAGGVPMLMTAHVICEALDAEWPATMSPAVIDGLLRRELGYGGVVVSDDLEMKAVADHWPLGEAAVRAIGAGCDLVLVCRKRELVLQTHRALAGAIGAQDLPPQRVAQALERLKKLGKRIARNARAQADTDCIGCEEHAQLAQRVGAGEATTGL